MDEVPAAVQHHCLSVPDLLIPCPHQVDNKSKVDIKSVQLLLEQCASIKDHVQMSRTVASHCFEGVVSFTSRTGGAALQAMLPVDHQLRATSLGQVCLWAVPLSSNVQLTSCLCAA